MAKNVLILSTSLRPGSNSRILAAECEKGALDAGHRVETVSLQGKDLRFCIGCFACHSTGACVLKDDVAGILPKVREADVLVFATPIYYYEMCGQMKTLLDRLNPLYTAPYRFREVYMLATAAEEGAEVFEKAYQGLQGWVDCFPKATLKGLLAAGDITPPNDAPNHPEAMKRAYEFGKNL